jgi:nucleoid-associated protein YejK
MEKQELYTSEEILNMEDLSVLTELDTVRYQMTDEELQWYNFVKGRYGIADYIRDNMDGQGIISLNDPEQLSKILEEDGIRNKAVCLSDETALQKIFFWYT